MAVVEIESISAVVGMIPFGKAVEGRDPRFFLAEKLGLDVYDSINIGSEDAGDEE